MNPFITTSSCRFLNLPAAGPVIQEVIREDCYRMSQIARGSIVLDVGAFYGEFGIYLAKEADCMVAAFEPSKENHLVAQLNADLNDVGPNYILSQVAVVGKPGVQLFCHNHTHPAGSGLKPTGGLVTGHDVNCVPLSQKVRQAIEVFGGNRPVVVKLDCEGAEREIFEEDPSWIDMAQIVTMEWHNYDGHLYRDILDRHGFKVELSGSGNPRPDYHPSFSGGLLFAHR